MIVWISRFHKLYGFFWWLRKFKVIEIIPCDSWKRFKITKGSMKIRKNI